jgi:glycosyltransferase involved in cell wall biosynthesis
MSGRPLRIATVITRLEGGAGQHALRGVQALDRDGFAPVIITGSGGRLVAQAAECGIEVVIEPMLRPTIAPRTDVRAVRWLSSVFAGLRPDVVHTHCAKAGAIGRLAARRAGIGRIVHTYHGFPFHEFQSAARRQAYVAMERRLGSFTDVGLCVGTGVAVEAIRRRLLPPERVRTIAVPVESTGADSSDPLARLRARRRLGLRPGSVVVGAVGRLTYQKAPEDFVTTIAALNRPDVTGVWVGGGELSQPIAALAKTSGADIVLAGDRDDVTDLLPAFDVFALPSRYEGLPTVIAEAMSCGVPVVATAVNAVGDLVEPGVTGLLVPPARPDLMASALGHVLDSPVAAARMAAAARGRIGCRYDAGTLAASLAAAYAPVSSEQADITLGIGQVCAPRAWPAMPRVLN